MRKHANKCRSPHVEEPYKAKLTDGDPLPNFAEDKELFWDSDVVSLTSVVNLHDGGYSQNGRNLMGDPLPAHAPTYTYQ